MASNPIFDKYTHYRILNSWQFYAVAFICYIIAAFCLISCKVHKEVITVRDTVNLGGKTEYVYQDTGTTITQYFPYFVRTKDTILQPIDRIIQKAGITIQKRDTFYINKTYYETKYNIKRTPYIPIWVYVVCILSVLFACYKIFK